MKCPACANQLTEVTASDVQVDVCDGGCGGIWFDNFEFKKFDEPHEQLGNELLEIKRAPNVAVDHSEKRNCPKCENITMIRHFFSVKKEVELDECANCGGIWLDTGELAKIRSLFNSEEERRHAAEELFDDMFGPELEKLAKEREKNVEGARRIANMFKFICPSYYLSGKQDWGAF